MSFTVTELQIEDSAIGTDDVWAVYFTTDTPPVEPPSAPTVRARLVANDVVRTTVEETADTPGGSVDLRLGMGIESPVWSPSDPVRVEILVRDTLTGQVDTESDGPTGWKIRESHSLTDAAAVLCGDEQTRKRVLAQTVLP